MGIGDGVWVGFLFFFLMLPASPSNDDGGECLFCCCSFRCLSHSIFLHSILWPDIQCCFWHSEPQYATVLQSLHTYLGAGAPQVTQMGVGEMVVVPSLFLFPGASWSGAILILGTWLRVSHQDSDGWLSNKSNGNLSLEGRRRQIVGGENDRLRGSIKSNQGAVQPSYQHETRDMTSIVISNVVVETWTKLQNIHRQKRDWKGEIEADYS